MVRALGLAFALVVASLGLCLCAAEETPAVSDADEVNSSTVDNGRPSPPSKHAGSSKAAAAANEDPAAEKELLDAANKSREAVGLPPLRFEESLLEAARGHAQLMVSTRTLEHQLPGEPALLDRIAEVVPESGELRIDRAGENIADATCAMSAHASLMHSPLHRKNLLDPKFTLAGFAAFWSGGRLYVVQDFAHEVPSYSAQQSRKLVGQAVDEARERAGLQELKQLTPVHLDEAACSLAKDSRPNAHLLETSYHNGKVIAYTQGHPEVLPPGALQLLRDPSVKQYAVGSCYARNATYPTGMYWVAILLY
jgi:uncharacterized protein YkwD